VLGCGQDNPESSIEHLRFSHQKQMGQFFGRLGVGGKDAGHGFQWFSAGLRRGCRAVLRRLVLEPPEVSNEALRISSSHEPFESVLKGRR